MLLFEEQIKKKNQQKVIKAHERSRAQVMTFAVVSSPPTHILGSARAPFLASTDLCKVEQENKLLRVRKSHLECADEHDLNGNSTAAYECNQKAVDVFTCDDVRTNSVDHPTCFSLTLDSSPG